VLQMLGHLEVQRDGTVPVDLDRQGGTVHGYLSHAREGFIMTSLTG
jgi:hypothetical protein